MLEWILVNPGSPYFSTKSGLSWTPVGQNDAISWPELIGAYKNKDMPAVIRYFEMLQTHGINCMRMMLEYCHTDRYYLERPAGNFALPMLAFWDCIFELCERFGIRLLLTPFDTFWMWRRWKHHPYNIISGGPCKQRSKWLLCPGMRNAVKRRFEFVTERWGGSGVIFAWDLWNEIRPAHGSNESFHMSDFVNDIGTYLKELELSIHGRAHLQTLTVFGHQLLKSDNFSGLLFRNPVLDFASTHFYEKGTIDNPKNIIAPALATGRMASEALQQINDQRPFLDTEHGPIYSYKRKKAGLPVQFDDAYFRLMQWAHLASGGSGGGMRWPYRQPHTLTDGMRKSQASLAEFVKLVAWNKFCRQNVNEEINIIPKDRFHVFACKDEKIILIWLLWKKIDGKGGTNYRRIIPEVVTVAFEYMKAGTYELISWNTMEGILLEKKLIIVQNDGVLRFNFNTGNTDYLYYANLVEM